MVNFYYRRYYNCLKAKYPGAKADIFDYTDPIDKSVSKNQGIRFVFEDGSRVVFRKSGTSSSGATLRIYFEKYESSADRLDMDLSEALKDITKLGLEVSDIQNITGRVKPTVIT